MDTSANQARCITTYYIQKRNRSKKSGTGTDSRSMFHKIWNSDSHFGTCGSKFGRNDLNSVPLPSFCHIVADLQKFTNQIAV
jgi:hypothetical protein